MPIIDAAARRPAALVAPAPSNDSTPTSAATSPVASATPLLPQSGGAWGIATQLSDAASAPPPPQLLLSPDDAQRVMVEARAALTGLIEATAPQLSDAELAMVDVVSALGEGERPHAELGTAAHSLGMDLQAALDDMEQALGRPLSEPERLRTLADTLVALLRNDSTASTAFRWLANVAHVGLRTGLIVGLATAMRQAVGFAAERALTLGAAADSTRAAIGYAAMALGPALNLVGLLRDELNHSATVQSRLARASMVSVTLATLAAAHEQGIMPLLGSFGTLATTYSLARDIAQLFLPLQDNAPIDWRSTALGGAGWSALQTPAGVAMDALAPDSGPGYAMAIARRAAQAAEAMLETAGPTASPVEREAAIQGAVRDALAEVSGHAAHDFIRGAINAVPEVVDDLLRPGLARYYQVQNILSQAEGGLAPEQVAGFRVVVAPRLPTASQSIQQLLNPDAMRISAFNTIYAVALMADQALAGIGAPLARSAAVGVTVSAACMAVYFPFVYVHVQNPAASASDGPVPEPPPVQAPAVEMQLRRRHTASVDSASRQSPV
jgi:hypothetical protein